MLRYFKIDNFKSLRDFELLPGGTTLAPFVVLVGENGAGKSSVLQALAMVAELSKGGLASWLEDRGWTIDDLLYDNARPAWIRFEVHVELADVGLVKWSGAYNPALDRVQAEEVRIGDVRHLLVEEGGFHIDDQTYHEIVFEYGGSLLSVLKLSRYPFLEGLKAFWSGFSSQGALSPALLRSVSSPATAVGVDGENLAGFVAALGADQLKELTRLIRTFYPELTSVVSEEKQPGVHNLFLHEDEVAYYASHAPDGVLRILAILAQTLVPNRLLVFDEIENGIHPALIARLVQVFQGLSSQVVVTTHSPLVLNYLADDVAREALVLLYRDRANRTRSRRFFDIEETAEKLSALGPGEVYADTIIEDLTARLQ